MSLAAAVVVRNLLIVVSIGTLAVMALGAIRKLLGTMRLGVSCSAGFAGAPAIEERE
jgi:hypothetical protein